MATHRKTREKGEPAESLYQLFNDVRAFHKPSTGPINIVGVVWRKIFKLKNESGTNIKCGLLRKAGFLHFLEEIEKQPCLPLEIVSNRKIAGAALTKSHSGVH